MNMVIEHNSKNSGNFMVGLNQFSDLTDEEFETRYLGEMPDEGQGKDPSFITEKSLMASQLDPVDWREKGVVNPVKDQGHCGSCWTFSTVGPIESHYAMKYGKLIVLAEQQLVDCAGGAYGNNGCNGGLYRNGYAYVQDYGIELTTDYPYVANDQACLYDKEKVAVEIKGAKQYENTIEGVKTGLSHGVVSISLHASADSFKHYTGGIYDDLRCPTETNHAVQTVGWGKEGDQEYIIVRNSWGPSWGEGGYVRIAAIQNDEHPLGICGIFFRKTMHPVIV